MLLLLLLTLQAVQGRRLGAGGREDPAVGQRGDVADVDARCRRRGDRGRGMRRRVEDDTALQHVAAIGFLLGLMMPRWTGRRWRTRGAVVLVLRVMMVPVVPGCRRLIVLRGGLF